MPDNPLQVERKGNLQEFGLPFAEGIVESDHGNPDPEEVEAQGTAPAEESTPKETPQEPTPEPAEQAPAEEAAPVEEEVVDDAEYDEMLGRVREKYQAPEEEEDDKDAALKARLANLENQLRTYQPQPAPAQQPAPQPEPTPEPETSGIDYEDPAVQAAIAQGLSDPRTAGSTIQALVNLEAKHLIGKELGTVKEQVQKIEATTTEESARSELSAQLAVGLQTAYNMGGLEAAVVREADAKREGSMLYQYLAMNPALATSPEGIITGVLAVSRAVQKADEELEPPAEKKGPAPLTTRRQTRATKRGQKLITPKEEGTPEETVKAEILGAGRPSQAVEFMR